MPDQACTAQQLLSAGIRTTSSRQLYPTLHQPADAGLPMLEIEALPDDPQQQRCLEALPEYSALIVGSKPAAQLGLALYQRYWPGAVQMQPWFTVGAATAGVLEDAGLQVHCPAQGDDSEALLALPSLAQALAVRTPRVLILRGTDRKSVV